MLKRCWLGFCEIGGGWNQTGQNTNVNKCRISCRGFVVGEARIWTCFSMSDDTSWSFYDLLQPLSSTSVFPFMFPHSGIFYILILFHPSERMFCKGGDCGATSFSGSLAPRWFPLFCCYLQCASSTCGSAAEETELQGRETLKDVVFVPFKRRNNMHADT